MSIVGIDKTNNVENVKIKKLLATDSKSVTKNNNFFKSTLASTTFRNNLNSPASKIIKDALPKIGKTNLFSIKKSGSQILLKKQNVQKAISNTNLEQKFISHNLSKSIGKHE